MNENIPTSTNNPGDLMYAGQAGATPTTKQTTAGEHTFAQFPTPQAGFGALLNQLSLNVKNKPNETLGDWANTYAPPSDGNDTGSYIAKLSNQLQVSPTTPISQLEPQIGKWADAVANNEGYQMNKPSPTSTNNQPQNTGSSSGGNNLLTGIAAIGGAGLSAVGGILGYARSALPSIGAVAGEALAPEGGPVSAAAGSAVGSTLEGLLGGNTSQSKDSNTQTQTATTPSTDSGVSQAINDVLSQTVKGNAVAQEAKNRGVGNVGDAMQKEGVIPSISGNGDYEKVPSALLLNAANGKDANAVEQLATAIPSQSNVSDVLGIVEESLAGTMKNTGEAVKMRDAVAKELGGLVQDKSAQTGKQLTDSQTFMSPSDWLSYRKHLSRQINKRSGLAYALPDDQRSALQHIERGVSKHLSGLAHLHGKGKEWDDAHKRMETRFLLKRAIAAMPKKAQRDFKKEAMRDIGMAVGGALLGKLSRTGPVGEFAGLLGGHLLSSKAGKRYYKELKKSSKRAKPSEDDSTEYD